MTHTRFAILAALCSYIGLCFAEYLRPGFVATGMNVHVILLVIGALSMYEVFASTHASNIDEQAPRSWLLWLCALVFGAILGLIVWRNGGVFEGMRLWISLIAAFAPLAFLKLSR